jgi:hypothetical protein
MYCWETDINGGKYDVPKDIFGRHLQSMDAANLTSRAAGCMTPTIRLNS